MAFPRPLIKLASRIDRKFGWHRLPTPIGLFTLIGLRDQLRAENLHDTGIVAKPPPRPANVNVRTLDGSWNDLERPEMGMLGTRFGRNVPLERAYPESEPDLLEPSPRLISRRLLAREQFIPATTVNVLAAAWIQFEVHDWMSHDRDQSRQIAVPVEEDDPWPEHPMQVEATLADPTATNGGPPVYATTDSHWWDASQIYGGDEEFARLARTGVDGKLALGDDGLHPEALDPILDPEGPRGNFWLGLEVLHAAFIREHNAICDALRREHGDWDDDRLHDVARLVNAAIMAKIHTVEWTPALIGHPTTERGMQAVWYGLAGRRIRQRFGQIGSDVVSGIPGSPTDHHTAPYSLTEEFVSVYRMHPLIPDDYDFLPLAGGPARHHRFPEIGPRQWRGPLSEIGIADALYSLGVAHPGAMVLHNYPTSLREDFRPDKDDRLVDLATVDILRDRERGVPRYNEFRALMHREPATSFEDLAGDPQTAAELREVYGDVDRVDLMVGLYAESRPRGFAFGDTAFRVFLLMASRRLKSDRFFTTHYTPEVYTATGLQWIEDATFASVLLRHYPELAPVIRRDNAFKPWRRAGA